MARRTYSSPVRDAAAAARRAEVLAVAERLLREADNAAAVAMETVAAAAGVTRLTVYKQFGSRRGLLEAVFDHRAAQGGLSRLPEAMAIDDARQGLDRLVEIFCAFWGGDPAVGRLQALAASDPEFAETVDARNERRRQAIQVLLARMGSPERIPKSGNRFSDGSARRDEELERRSDAVGSQPAPERADHRRDAVDLIFTLTGYATYRSLIRNRSDAEVCALIKAACASALDLGQDAGGSAPRRLDYGR
jgi:AcrR family transcriptional regulator